MSLETRRAALALLLLVPVPSLGVLAGMFLLPGKPSGALLFFAAKIWVFLLPAAWRRFVDRRPASLSPMRRGGLRAGILTGVVMAAAIVAAYLLLGERLIERSAVIARMAEIGLGRPGVFLATAAYWILVNSVLEEYVWRWFVVRQGEVLVGPGRAVILSAAGFTLHHVLAMSLYFSPAATILASAGIFAAGCVWSWCYVRYRSIWPGYLSHALADLAIFGVGWALIFGG